MASIKLLFKFEYQFSPTNYNQDGRQNVRRLSICFCLWTIYHNHLSLYHLQISHMDYFYQTLALSNNQDGRQYGRHLSVYTCGHSNLAIYHPVPSKLHIWTSFIYHPISSKLHIWTSFIKLLFMCEYGYCLMNDYQYFRHGDIPFSLQGIRRSPLSESDRSGFVFFLLVCCY